MMWVGWLLVATGVLYQTVGVAAESVLDPHEWQGWWREGLRTSSWMFLWMPLLVLAGAAVLLEEGRLMSDKRTLVGLVYRPPGKDQSVVCRRELSPEAVSTLLLVMDALSECEPERLGILCSNLQSEV